jgi:hypothetical protein
LLDLAPMLRVSGPTRAPDGAATLIVEGRLIGAWVAELGRVTADEVPESLVLQLHGLAFADPEGVRLLRGLRDRGARLLGASPFVELLVGG